MTTPRRVLHSTNLVLLVLAAGCGGGDVAAPPPGLGVMVSGRLERGAPVSVSVDGGSGPLAPGAVTWTTEPAGALTVLPTGEARFLVAGRVTVTAASGSRRGSVTVSVAPPPSIVFDLLRNGNRDIYIAAIDGQDLVRLTSDPADDRAPAVGGGSVVFVSSRDGNAELYAVPLAGGAERRLTTTTVNESDPALSGDGSRLAYTSDAAAAVPKLWVAAGDGSDAHRALSAFGGATSAESSPAWTRGGERLAFAMGADAGTSIYQIGSDGGVTRLVAAERDGGTAWGPDGSRLAFVARRGERTVVAMLDVSSGQLRDLTAGGDSQPTWLLDGRLVYISTSSGAARLTWLDPNDPTLTPHAIPIADGTPGHPVGAR